MRILQAIHDFLPEHRAGSEIYTYHLSRALAERGHDLHLLFTEKRPDRPQFETTQGTFDGLSFDEVVYNREFSDISDLYDDPRMEDPVGEVLDAFRPDLVHIQSIVYLGLSLIRAATARGIPSVMTLHEYFLLCPRGGLLTDLDGNLCDPIDPSICARCIEPYPMLREKYGDGPEARYESLGDLRFFARAIEKRRSTVMEGVKSVSRFVAPSQFLGDRMVREGLDAERLVVADYGFPPVAPVAPVDRGPEEPLRLGYLGTISDYKGVHVAIDAIAQVGPKTATLRVKGDLGWFPDYSESLSRRAVPGVSLEGPLESGGFPRFLAEIDALVVPSLWYENSPLTIHEAFQCEVPVLATDLGGMAELVSQGGGRLFRRGDAADLARRIRELADNPSLLGELRDTIPPVKTISRNAEEMETIYEEIC